MPAFIIHYATTEFKQKTELHLKRHFCAPIFKIKGGFEPSNRFAGYTISNRAPSTKLGDFSVYSVGHLRRLRFL